MEGKGRGVVSTRRFSRGELVCEYSGELISLEEAREREAEYGKDPSVGCYMYYFSHKSNKLWQVFCFACFASMCFSLAGRLIHNNVYSVNTCSCLLCA